MSLPRLEQHICSEDIANILSDFMTGTQEDHYLVSLTLFSDFYIGLIIILLTLANMKSMCQVIIILICKEFFIVYGSLYSVYL